MKKRIYIFGSFVILAIVQLACVIPGFDENSAENTNGNTVESIQNTETVHDVEINVEATPSVPETGNESCTYLMSASADVSQGQVFAPATPFEVQWTLTNAGTCIWKTTDALVLLEGDLPADVERIALGQPVAAGQSIVIQVGFSTPSAEGTYESLWKMETGTGAQFGLAPSGDNPCE